MRASRIIKLVALVSSSTSRQVAPTSRDSCMEAAWLVLPLAARACVRAGGKVGGAAKRKRRCRRRDTLSRGAEGAERVDGHAPSPRLPSGIERNEATLYDDSPSAERKHVVPRPRGSPDMNGLMSTPSTHRPSSART